MRQNPWIGQGRVPSSQVNKKQRFGSWGGWELYSKFREEKVKIGVYPPNFGTFISKQRLNSGKALTKYLKLFQKSVFRGRQIQILLEKYGKKIQDLVFYLPVTQL